jgi:hypothetical protein
MSISCQGCLLSGRGLCEGLIPLPEESYRLCLCHLTRITGTLHEDICTFMTISRIVFLRMRTVSDKICRENQNI